MLRQLAQFEPNIGVIVSATIRHISKNPPTDEEIFGVLDYIENTINIIRLGPTVTHDDLAGSINDQLPVADFSTGETHLIDSSVNPLSELGTGAGNALAGISSLVVDDSANT